MKFIRFVLIGALMSVFSLSLCSCDLKDTALRFFDEVRRQTAVVADEYDDIVEFFEYELTSYVGAATTEAAFASADTEMPPVLLTLPHPEIIESPYNSAETTVFFSASGVDFSDKTSLLDESQKYGYTEVLRFDDYSTAAVSAVLDKAGIEYNICVRKNTAPSGEVFAVEFAGISDKSAFYINSEVPVTLYVSAEKPAEIAEGEKNTIYFTYDDGPTSKNTRRLLDILDLYGVKATFFTTGEAVRKYPESALAVVERGHILGCHSVSHDYEKIYSSVSALEAEVLEWESIVAEAGIILQDKLFRFPGGSVGKYFSADSSIEMKTKLEDMGYSVFDWNVVTNDSLLFMRDEGENVYDYIRKNFIETFELCLNENKEKDNAPIIILMHETVTETVELMPWMIEYLISRGYSFGSLGNLGESWTFNER